MRRTPFAAAMGTPSSPLFILAFLASRLFRADGDRGHASRYNFDGVRLRVEISQGPRQGARPTGGLRRTDYRVIVTGIPPTGSWQDLKVRTPTAAA